MRKVGIPAETQKHENRVAVSAETVKKLVALGYEVAVEKGAGERASISDAAFKQAGAKVFSSSAETLKEADIVLKVQHPSQEEISAIKRGAILIGLLAPYTNQETMVALAEAGINAFAMEFMPRITRAQSMDVLSSQANLAGYRAVIDAAAAMNRAMPMMMTPAGTVAPTRVLVLGAGVAGLQAIATARRLGAIVSATDVRLAAKEQVESLGATFVSAACEKGDDGETTCGYAKEMDDDFKRRQQALISDTLKKQDMAICTALIPGRPAPNLITKEMVKGMQAGSVIVDLAVEQGGNCELSKAGEIVQAYGVTILGHLNMASRVAANASALYAKNVLNFIASFMSANNGTVKIDWDDEIVKSTAVTRDGAVVHPALVAVTENMEGEHP
jgi:NAD(P) transhydrogenase subunit alpha